MVFLPLVSLLLTLMLLFYPGLDLFPGTTYIFMSASLVGLCTRQGSDDYLFRFEMPSTLAITLESSNPKLSTSVAYLHGQRFFVEFLCYN